MENSEDTKLTEDTLPLNVTWFMHMTQQMWHSDVVIWSRSWQNTNQVLESFEMVEQLEYFSSLYLFTQVIKIPNLVAFCDHVLG